MAIDAQVDAPLAALGGLVRGAINIDLGEEFVVSMYDDPRALETLTAGKLPALCIYRASERRRRRNSTALVRDITVQVDYVLPATALEKRPVRWPALGAVWHVIDDTVLAGKHAGVAFVLDAAGLFVEQENSARVNYSLAAGGAQAYPFFRGEFVVTFTPDEVDVDTLNDFLRFHMSFDEPGGDGSTPLIELDLTLPQ